MVMESVLICVHGYTQNMRAGERTWREVMNDRLKRAVKLAEFFKNAGVINYLVLSGGVVSNDGVEADAIYEYAKTTFPVLFNLVTDVILERESKNTLENVVEIMKWAIKKNAAIIAVSSKDHVSRVIKDWDYSKDIENHLILVAPSAEPYSEIGSREAPLVIEPPSWAYEELKDLFKIPESKQKDVKKLLKDAILFGLK